MSVYYYQLLSHGCGPIRQLAIVTLGLLVRLSIGGYGNIPAPSGSWRWFPRAENRYGYLRLYWFNVSVSVFRKYRADQTGVLCGFSRVF